MNAERNLKHFSFDLFRDVSFQFKSHWIHHYVAVLNLCKLQMNLFRQLSMRAGWWFLEFPFIIIIIIISAFLSDYKILRSFSSFAFDSLSVSFDEDFITFTASFHYVANWLLYERNSFILNYELRYVDEEKKKDSVPSSCPNSH